MLCPYTCLNERYAVTVRLMLAEKTSMQWDAGRDCSTGGVQQLNMSRRKAGKNRLESYKPSVKINLTDPDLYSRTRLPWFSWWDPPSSRPTVAIREVDAPWP
jgi:hypothetical protein